MATKIVGAQHDFSFWEVDSDLKRADDHPARKGGLRQASNVRIRNSGIVQNRPGRRALYNVTNGGLRTERFAISPGNVFDIQFAAGRLKIIDSAGTVVANFVAQGNTAALPWTADNLNTIVYATFNLSVYVTFGHSMIPQVVTWDGVSTWAITDYTEMLIGTQKRTPFYRISPQGVTIQPLARTGSGVTMTASAGVFSAAWVGTRLRYIGRQILVTAFNNPASLTVTIEEPLPGNQILTLPTDPALTYVVGDVVLGSVTKSKGVVVAINTGLVQMTVQLLNVQSSSSSVESSVGSKEKGIGSAGTGESTVSFTTADTVVGPGGSAVPTAVSGIGVPQAVAIWDEEVMNTRGYPASVFSDQFRLGFCDFSLVPNGIAWSSINAPSDLYVGANPSDAIFEVAPQKVRVYHVVPGPESSEFVFCDRKIYYIPISPTNPLAPGRVAFQILSGDGAAQVQPRASQEVLLYVNAGQSSMMAIIATGAYQRPFNTKNLSDFHGHLFSDIKAIAAPSADGTFSERYIYVLNRDNSLVVGKYNPDSLQGNAPVIGWGPWSGSGVVNWVGAYAADVLFTSTYFGVTPIAEVLDDTHYLDCAMLVNAAPTSFAPPFGKGPLWYIPSQTVTLIDQGTRVMGAYQVDANGFIVPQFNGGEDLTALSLVAGQPWTATVEPFCPNAPPGSDIAQRISERQISNFAAWVKDSTGFLMAGLFSSKQTPTSPALGTPMNQRRVTAYNQGDNPILPPTLRETVEFHKPPGSTFDPRVAIIKDTPGPLQIMELVIECSV